MRSHSPRNVVRPLNFNIEKNEGNIFFRQHKGLKIEEMARDNPGSDDLEMKVEEAMALYERSRRELEQQLT